jgi:hypothetical protein
MKTLSMHFFLLIFGLNCSGCFYFNQPVTFTVQDAETKQPIEGVGIDPKYIGLFVPQVNGGVTDANGKLTLFMDTKAESLSIAAGIEGYQSESNMWGTAIQKRLFPRPGSLWGSNFVLEMYKDPAAEMNLVIPTGYRGVVLIQFAPMDSPPQQIGQRIFSYELDLEGKVLVRESGLFERMQGYYQINARFREGIEIPTVKYQNETRVPSDALALRFITPVWEHHTWVYVVGTKDEENVIHNALWGDGSHFDEGYFKRLSGIP